MLTLLLVLGFARADGAWATNTQDAMHQTVPTPSPVPPPTLVPRPVATITRVPGPTPTEVPTARADQTPTTEPLLSPTPAATEEPPASTPTEVPTARADQTPTAEPLFSPTPAATEEPPVSTLVPGSPSPDLGQPLLGLDLAPPMLAVWPGVEFVTVLNISNSGQAAAREAVATLYVAGEVAILETEATRGEVAVEDGRVVLRIGQLAPGETVALAARLRLPEDLPRGIVLENQADLTHTGGKAMSAPSLLVTEPAWLPETGNGRSTAMSSCGIGRIAFYHTP